MKWCSKATNGVSAWKRDVLKMLRRCAEAATDAAYDNAKNTLKASEPWNKSYKLRRWFINNWDRIKHVCCRGRQYS